MRKIVLCILGTLTINCGPKEFGDRDSRGGTLIGPSGGVVEGPGGARIEIPEGALSEDVQIGIRLADSSDLEGINWSALETTVDDRFVTAEVTSFSFFQPGAAAPEEDDGVEQAGDAYEVTPHGQQFQRPVRVMVPYRRRVEGLGLFRAQGEADKGEYVCTEYPNSWNEDFNDGTYQGDCSFDAPEPIISLNECPEEGECSVDDGRLVVQRSSCGVRSEYEVILCCDNKIPVAVQWDWVAQGRSLVSISLLQLQKVVGAGSASRLQWVAANNKDEVLSLNASCEDPSTQNIKPLEFGTAQIKVNRNDTHTARLEINTNQYHLFHNGQQVELMEPPKGHPCTNVSFNQIRFKYSFGATDTLGERLDNLIISCDQ